MNIEGLDYNTEREKLRLKAYGRDIQQMVDFAVELPTKAERQKAAEKIVDAMKRIVPSQQSFKERTPMLWYHLALLSDFKLDIDYPVEFEHKDKLATPPEKVPYNQNKIPVRHYGKLIFDMLSQLKELPDGPIRKTLSQECAAQMYRSLMNWGFGSVSKERVADDMARYTDGVIQVDPESIKVVNAANPNKKNNRRKKK